MSSRQHSPKAHASKVFSSRSPTIWLANFSRSMEDPKNRRAVFAILALLTGLVALTALFETENQLFPIQRSLVPINADQIYRKVWSDPWNTGGTTLNNTTQIITPPGGGGPSIYNIKKPKVIIEGTRDKSNQKDLTRSWQGVLSVVVFVCGYALAIAEESIGRGFKKSIPITVAAGIIWALVALGYRDKGHAVALVTQAARHNLTEFVEVFLFLLCAMTFINTMTQLNVFARIRSWLQESGFSYRSCFWVTGTVAFWLSPIADNLTTAVLMGAVVTAVGKGEPEYVAMCCVNIVVAANSGGAFSPFGDLTTLMVWQRGTLSLTDFPRLLIPSIVNWVVPACLMHPYVKDGAPAKASEEDLASSRLKPGAVEVICLFLGTVVMTAMFHSYAHLPPVLGMMTGLGLLKLFGWSRTSKATHQRLGTMSNNNYDDENNNNNEGNKYSLEMEEMMKDNDLEYARTKKGNDRALDIFKRLEQTEWDTLIFFYGVIMCVGGLGVLGYLELLSHNSFRVLGANAACILIGLLSAVIDNIPMMYAVLSTEPEMSKSEWLLITLSAGVGGSLFSVGSAAGVGLMGVSHSYTFLSHLKWTPIVLVGYFASILTHFMVNGM